MLALFCCSTKKPIKEKSFPVSQRQETSLNQKPQSPQRSINQGLINSPQSKINKRSNDSFQQMGNTIDLSQTSTSKDILKGNLDNDEISLQVQKIKKLRETNLEKSVKQEEKFVQTLMSKSNEEKYVISHQWALKYTNFLKFPMKNQITSINNGILLQNEYSQSDQIVVTLMKNPLRPGIKVDVDYAVLNEYTWNFIQLMYGGGPQILLECRISQIRSSSQPHSQSESQYSSEIKKPPEEVQQTKQELISPNEQNQWKENSQNLADNNQKLEQINKQHEGKPPLKPKGENEIKAKKQNQEVEIKQGSEVNNIIPKPSERQPPSTQRFLSRNPQVSSSVKARVTVSSYAVKSDLVSNYKQGEFQNLNESQYRSNNSKNQQSLQNKQELSYDRLFQEIQAQSGFENSNFKCEIGSDQKTSQKNLLKLNESNFEPNKTSQPFEIQKRSKDQVQEVSKVSSQIKYEQKTLKSSQDKQTSKLETAPFQEIAPQSQIKNIQKLVKDQNQLQKPETTSQVQLQIVKPENKNQIQNTQKQEATSQVYIQNIWSIRQITIPIVGLQNRSYYCYMNSALQCLMSIPQLNFLLLQIKGKSICQSYQEFLEQIKQKGGKNVPVFQASRIQNLSSRNFSNFEQHDTHEWLLWFLSEMQEELIVKKKLPESQTAIEALNVYFQSHNDPIDHLFAGQLSSQIYCPKCKKNSNQFDPTFDFQLPMKSSSFLSSDNSLEECLELYFRDELIDDRWKCDNCNNYTTRVKRTLKISHTPNILILCFKRFTLFPRKEKIRDNVIYNKEINISKFCIKEVQYTKYQLKSVIVHSGGINGGHYVAYTKREDKWYCFNDDTVEKSSENEALSQKQAYVLFYEKQQK